MAGAYLVLAYDVSDPEGYAKYNPGSMPTLMATLGRHGGTVLAAQHGADFLAGAAREMCVVLRFPSKAAAGAWMEDPEYLPLKKIRLAATTNIITFIADEFVPPGG